MLLAVAPAGAAQKSDGAAQKSDWEVKAKGAAKAFATDTIDHVLNDNTVVIFSKSTCSASKRVKSYFEDEGIPYYALELDRGHRRRRDPRRPAGVVRCSSRRGLVCCAP